MVMQCTVTACAAIKSPFSIPAVAQNIFIAHYIYLKSRQLAKQSQLRLNLKKSVRITGAI
jgi:hypothetical protein